MHPLTHLRRGITDNDLGVFQRLDLPIGSSGLATDDRPA